MKRITPFFIFTLSLLFIFSCKPSSDNVNVTVIDKAPPAAEGFDLEQFHKLLIEEGKDEKTWDAQFLSDLVNREDVNNLDLNLNGTVDTILVEPFDEGEHAKGFTLYTVVVNNPGTNSDEEQTIATVLVERDGENGTLTTTGNEQLYGNHYHYRSSNVGTFFLMYWMFSPRYSYGRNYYSSYNRNYAPRKTATTSAYKNKISNRNASHTGTKAAAPTRPSSANTAAAAKQRTAAKGIKSSMTNPTSSQRSYRARSIASSKASGFGSKSSGTKSRTSSGRTSRSFGK